MKKFIISVVFCLAMSGFSFAQSKLPELEKIKQIKLLESAREDVKRIFSEYEKNSEGDKYWTDNVTIRISYSSGDCSDDGDEAWNVAEGKVTEVFVLLNDSFKPKDLKIDLSKLERLKRGEDDDEEDDEFIYYDKEKGVSYEVSEGEVSYIKFIPPEKNYPALCNNENVRQFKSDKEWFRHKIKEVWVCYLPRPFANVVELNLSKNEITEDCPAGDLSNIKSDDDYFKIQIETKGESSDPTDVLTYNYTVSGGRIIGNGAKVTWDLNGVKPGKYTIIAGVDNGCGVCGETKTQEVIIKEPSCQPK